MAKPNIKGMRENIPPVLEEPCKVTGQKIQVC